MRIILLMIFLGIAWLWSLRFAYREHIRARLNQHAQLGRD